VFVSSFALLKSLFIEIHSNPEPGDSRAESRLSGWKIQDRRVRLGAVRVANAKGEKKMRKTPLLLVIAIFVVVSLSCTNPITSYFGTQTAVMDTATATMWTPTPTFTPTNTPTNTPTDTPTFTPTPDYLYKDDFEDSNSGWDESNDTYVLFEYTDGGYRMKVKVAQIFVWALVPENDTYDNVRIEVDAQRIGGPNDTEMGIIARYKNRDNFYVFMITNDGQAIIFKITNSIAAVCDGEDLELYVNDELVASASDSSLKKGQVGLVVGNGNVAGADVLFDNLFIRPL
jgi:hypothetical protein